MFGASLRGEKYSLYLVDVGFDLVESKELVGE
jgi:hypothetical protein